MTLVYSITAFLWWKNLALEGIDQSVNSLIA